MKSYKDIYTHSLSAQRAPGVFGGVVTLLPARHARPDTTWGGPDTHFTSRNDLSQS